MERDSREVSLILRRLFTKIHCTLHFGFALCCKAMKNRKNNFGSEIDSGAQRWVSQRPSRCPVYGLVIFIGQIIKHRDYHKLQKKSRNSGQYPKANQVFRTSTDFSTIYCIANTLHHSSWAVRAIDIFCLNF